MEQAAWSPSFGKPKEGEPGPAGPVWKTVEVPDCGLGLQATAAIEPGELLFRVPLGACWPNSVATVKGLLLGAEGGNLESEHDAELSDEGATAIWLCEQRRKGTSSAFAGQIAALPHECDGVILWTEEELAELQGSCFHGVAVGLREETDAEWEALSTSSFWTRWRAGSGGISKEEFVWCKATVLSRQVELELDGCLAVESAKYVIPVFDLLNHDAAGKPSCEFAVEAHSASSVEDMSLVVRTTRSVCAGEDLSNWYGPLPNSSLLITHGFVVPGNPYDCVELILSLPVPSSRRPWLRHLEQSATGTQFELLIDEGDDADDAFEFVMRHNLTQSAPLPSTLLAVVRLQVYSLEELDHLSCQHGSVELASLGNSNGLVAPPRLPKVSSEAKAMAQVASILRGLLDGHPHTDAEDSACLGQAECPESQTVRRRRMAATVRCAEKRILAVALAAIS